MNKSKLLNKINPLFNLGIAHRGLHNEQFTENGMNAFKNAIDHNFAFELDVHLSKNNHLIVCHDDNLKRTTNKEGIIEELTLDEIKTNYKLLDGSEIPTLQEVLKLNNEQVPLVIELKVRKGNYAPLAKQLKKELTNIKDKRNFFLISFDPRALIRTKSLKITTGLLVCKEHEWVYKTKSHFDSLDLEFTMTEQERVRKYQKKKFVNVWTIESIEDFEKVYPYVDTVTFQHVDYEYIRNRLKEKYNK